MKAILAFHKVIIILVGSVFGPKPTIVFAYIHLSILHQSEINISQAAPFAATVCDVCTNINRGNTPVWPSSVLLY